MKSIATLLAVLLLASTAAGETIDRIACVVDDQVITLSEVEDRAKVLRSRSPSSPNHSVMQEAADSLIAEKLLERQLEALGIDIRPSELQLAIDDVIRQNGLPSEEALRSAIERQGMSWEAYRETLHKQLAQMKLINLRVRSQVQITDDEIRRRYGELVAAESGEEEVKASHILVLAPADASAEEIERARVHAAELSKKAKEGENFQAMAKESSDGPSKTSGGDLGWFRRGEMVRELEEVAFSHQPGEVSEPVRTRFGWHVLWVEQKRAVPPPAFEEASAQLREKLYDEELERQTQRYVESLKKEAVIEFPMEELAPPSLRTRAGG